jgi:hypothetical protein
MSPRVRHALYRSSFHLLRFTLWLRKGGFSADAAVMLKGSHAIKRLATGRARRRR